jgi:hypothetical protein
MEDVSFCDMSLRTFGYDVLASVGPVARETGISVLAVSTQFCFRDGLITILYAVKSRDYRKI